MIEISRPTQEQEVLDYMKRNGSITQFEAFKELGIMRLASRISELKKTHPIRKEWITVLARNGREVRVKRYSLYETHEPTMFVGAQGIMGLE